jgi:CHAD domain-containing protein
VRESADNDAVHDLRVAIRRCRTAASIMREVDAHREWHELRRSVRKLFRALGALRDLQVRRELLDRLMRDSDPGKAALLAALDAQESAPRKRIGRLVGDFDERRWMRLAERLHGRLRLVTPGTLEAQGLVLGRFVQLTRLHRRAMSSRQARTWHALRIGLKRFRYALEILLPVKSAAWGRDLGRGQDALGEIHDLEELKLWVGRLTETPSPSSLAALVKAAAERRESSVNRYRTLVESHQLLERWGTGWLAPHVAADARLKTIGRAMDEDRGRTAAVTRLVFQLFDGLANIGAASEFQRVKTRAVLGAAARLHGISVGGRRRRRHKDARDIIRQLPAPPGWKRDDWMLVAEIVRYQRGAEPIARHGRFARLPEDRQRQLRGLAGVLRLARALQEAGTTAAAVLSADDATVQLRVVQPNREDTAAAAARLAAAAHLLEVYLERRIIMRADREAADTVHYPRSRRRVGRATSLSDGSWPV